MSTAENDLFDILEEVGGLAASWRNMCLALRVPDADTIGNKWRDDPKDCLREILKQWLKKCYDTQKHGPPTWRKLVEAVANDYGGDNPALAETIALKHQSKYSPNNIINVACSNCYTFASMTQQENYQTA